MRLIDADRVVATVTAENTRDDDTLGYADGLLDGIEVFAEALRNAPTVDAAPVVHGRWVEWFPGNIALIMTGEEMLWECSHCTAKYAERSNYCPNCGAKMDGGERDGQVD